MAAATATSALDSERSRTDRRAVSRGDERTRHHGWQGRIDAPALGALILSNAVGSSIDVLSFFFIAIRVPAGALLWDHGPKTYWRQSVESSPRVTVVTVASRGASVEFGIDAGERSGMAPPQSYPDKHVVPRMAGPGISRITATMNRRIGELAPWRKTGESIRPA